jgi:hypothetical protein
VCMCVCARARACECTCVCVCVYNRYDTKLAHIPVRQSSGGKLASHELDKLAARDIDKLASYPVPSLPDEVNGRCVDFGFLGQREGLVLGYLLCSSVAREMFCRDRSMTRELDASGSTFEVALMTLRCVWGGEGVVGLVRCEV